MATQSSLDKIFSALSTQQDAIRDGVAQSAVSAGLNLMQKKKYTEAAAAFKQAISLKPDYIDAYNMAAGAYLKLGKRKEAADAYTISLKLDRSQSQVRTNLASVYIDDKKYPEAQKELKLASQLDPTNPLPHYTLGLLLQQIDKPVEAEAEFRKTITLARKDGNAYYGLGLALNKQQRYSDAIPELQRALELKKDSVPALFELGNAYAALGETDKAQEQLDRLKTLNTSTSLGMASDLAAILRKPKMTGYDSTKSSFNPALSSISLLALDTSFIEPSTSKEFSMTFTFDTEMDAQSVTKMSNWLIKRASGGTAGLYDNGLYRPTDRATAPIFPSRVTYNPVDKSATVYFSLSQNDTASGTIDPSHLTFKFLGKDLSGKTMDQSADEFTGFKGSTF
jgi:tetratricopeptide (TPR) repeat protein